MVVVYGYSHLACIRGQGKAPACDEAVVLGLGVLLNDIKAQITEDVIGLTRCFTAAEVSVTKHLARQVFERQHNYGFGCVSFSVVEKLVAGRWSERMSDACVQISESRQDVLLCQSFWKGFGHVDSSPARFEMLQFIATSSVCQ
jgi:hypothetical protein